MDFEAITQLAGSQGPVFWIATVAIALGATLLVTATIQALRRAVAARLTSDRVRVVSAEPAATRAQDTVAAGDVYLPGAQPLPQAAPPSRPRAATAGDDCSLALLLRRLQLAGDRLEEIAVDLGNDDTARDESVLKDELRDVEYVFKASGP